MKDISRLFDYFKEAFHLNKDNRRLYMPQIILIVLKTCMFLAFGIFIYQVMVSFGYRGFNENVIKDAVFGMAWWIGGMVLVGIFGGIILEAGLFNMYRVCIQEKELRSGEFFEGVQKNFLRFFLADFIMLIVWLLILIPYLIIGVLSLLTGFVLIPLMISVFTVMWKVSMALDDVFVIEGFKRGFRFATEHFIPLTVLVIIRESFLNIGNGSWNSNSSSGDTSESTTSFIEDLPVDIEAPDIPIYQGYLQALPYIKIGFYIMLPVISAAIIIGSLVRMVFQIFFGLTSFIMYADNEDMTLSQLPWEVE